MNEAKKNEKKLKVGLLKAVEQLIKKKQWHCEKKRPTGCFFHYNTILTLYLNLIIQPRKLDIS